MCKMDTICLIAHGVCEEGDLHCGKMSTGVGNHRGRRLDRDGGAMGGRAWRANRQGP